MITITILSYSVVVTVTVAVAFLTSANSTNGRLCSIIGATKPGVVVVTVDGHLLTETSVIGTIIDELGVAIDQPHSAKEVILVGFGRDVHPNALLGQVGTDLFDHGGLTIARQPGDVGDGEVSTPNDLGDRIVVAPTDIFRNDGRDQGAAISTGRFTDEVDDAHGHGFLSVCPFYPIAK